MQSSQTTHDLQQDDNEYKAHKPVKLVRSHEIDIPKQPPRTCSPFRKNRSRSSSFRHSIRHLTSCALPRRKPSRSKDPNDQNSTTTDSSPTLDDDLYHSSNILLIPTQSSPSSLSPSQKKNKRHIVPLMPSTRDDMPPTIPPRKPLDKKNSGPLLTTPSNIPIFNNSSQIPSATNDDISLIHSRRLSSKEISTSLVNLMGTASDSVLTNNTTQIPTHETKHIASTPASTVDRLGLLETSANAVTTGMVESPTTHRTVFTGNSYSANSSPSSYTKSTNEYTWCYEISSDNDYSPRLEIDDKPLIYRQEFVPTEHFNWYGLSDSQGPVIISYKYSNDHEKQRYIKAIIRTRQRTSIESLLNILSLSSMDILRRICEQCAITDIEYFDPVLCDGTHDLLMKYDESHVTNKHKFGIIYQRENQITEEDIFSNETHSIAMDKFLDLIGTRVKLKDFQGFRGGLDVKSDYTGTESIYEQFNDHEIMFHVSTLLPHSKIERQQLERKRHIGNDIVAIVFQETETIFNPECITSQFLHVYLVITPLDNDGTSFKVSVIYRDNVPSFGPSINQSQIFHCDQIFKQWILTKLINAEMASCRANTIQKYHERTKMNLFENLYRTLHDNNRSLMNFIINHSQYKHECEREQAQIYASVKAYDRHTDHSLLGSVKRRFIAPKFRPLQSTTPPPSAILISTPMSNNTNDTKLKSRTMTIDLKRSASRESMTTNGNNHGKTASFFFLTRNNNPRVDKSNTNRSVLENESLDSSFSPRSNSKFLSPVTCPSTPSNDLNNGDLYVFPTPFDINKSTSDDTDHDNQNQLLYDDLQSSSKDDLIKCVLALQQQHSTKLAQMDQIHSNAIKKLQMQLMQKQHTIDGENL